MRTRPINAQTLSKLYLTKRNSIPQIASKLGLPKSNVEYWLEKAGIPRRFPFRYPRLPFSGTERDMAYLSGFALGDLYVKRLMSGVLVSSTSTHPAFIALFRMMFGKYGKVTASPAFDSKLVRYQWVIRTTLDPSFNFMIKGRGVPSFVSEKDFLHFFAGFFDAEGTINIAFRVRSVLRKEIEVSLSVVNTNWFLMKEIATRMHRFHPVLSISQRAGTPTSYNRTTRKRDLWILKFSKREEVRALLSELPIAHEEKKLKARLARDILEGIGWDSAVSKLQAIRRNQGDEVRELSERAGNSLSRNSN